MPCSNCRPISVVPLFSKLLEELMHKRLMSYLKQFNLLYEQQFGFQEGKSTEHALIALQSNIIQAIKKKYKA